MILRKLIKKFNAKYGKEFGMIDSDFSNSGLYQAYKLISQLCKYDDEIMDMLDKIVLPLPTNPIETLEYAQIKAPQVVTKYNELEEKPVVKLEGTEDNPIILSELEVGMYVVDTDIEKSKMKYFEDDATTMNLTRQMVLINEFYNIKYVNTYSLFDGIATTYELDLANKKVRNYRGVTGEDVLAKDNTFEYEPTEDFHPATKKYVDDTTSSNSIEISDEEYDSLYDSKGTKILLGEMTKSSKGTPILTTHGDGVYNVNFSAINSSVTNGEDLILEETLGNMIQVNKLSEDVKYKFNKDSFKDMRQLDYLEINDNNEEPNNIFANSQLSNVDKVVVKSGNVDSLFEKCSKLQTVNEIDLSGSTSAKNLFNECYDLHSIGEIKGTENIFYFDNMFSHCPGLKKFPTISTSNALSLSGLFEYTQLKEAPELDTSNVTDMSRMYCDAQYITEIPEYDTTNVTNFNRMFYNTSITSLPSNFNVSKGEDFSYMFTQTPLVEINSPFDTSNAIDMSYLFYGTKINRIPEGFVIPSTCKYIDGMLLCDTLEDTLPPYDFNNIETMVAPFGSGISFSQEEFNTINCNSFGEAFADNSNITNITLDITNVKNNSNYYPYYQGLGNLFNGSYNLTEVYLKGNATNPCNMMYLCSGCTNLISVTSDVKLKPTNMAYAFNNCKKLETMPNMDFSECTSVNGMFYDCNKLQNNIEVYDFRHITDITNCFRNCWEFREINLANTENIVCFNRGFNACKNVERITGLDISSGKFENRYSEYMFNSNNSLKYIDIKSNNSYNLIFLIKNHVGQVHLPAHSGAERGTYVFDISKCTDEVIDEVIAELGTMTSTGWTIVTGREEELE